MRSLTVHFRITNSSRSILVATNNMSSVELLMQALLHTYGPNPPHRSPAANCLLFISRSRDKLTLLFHALYSNILKGRTIPQAVVFAASRGLLVNMLFGEKNLVSHKVVNILLCCLYYRSGPIGAVGRALRHSKRGSRVQIPAASVG